MATEDGSLTQDVVFDILSSARRRYVLYLLRTSEEPIEMTDLAERVAAWENDTTVEELTKQQRKRVYVSLYQTHVPKLEDAGLVAYEQDSGIVELTAAAAGVDRYLDTEEPRFPWPYLYLPLILLGTGLVALTTFDVWVFGSLSGTGLGIVIVSGLLLSVAAHLIVRATYQRQAPEDLRRRR